MMVERGVEVDHTTIMRWVHQYSPEIEKKVRRYLKRFCCKKSGGGANYLKLLKTHSKEPAFFFTPMYASSWRELLNIDKLHSNPDKALKMAKKINDLAGYSRVAKVNTGLTYVKDIDKKINEYAKLFGYSTFEVSGTQKIFEKCYLSIKKEIMNIV